jgi:replicative DNA helicase
MANRKLPHHPEAEAFVIAAMIGDREIIPEIVEILGDGKAFYSETNHAKYQQIKKIYDEGGIIDLPGGGGSAGASMCATLIKEKALLRRLIIESGKLCDSIKIITDEKNLIWNEMDDVDDRLNEMLDDIDGRLIQ